MKKKANYSNPNTYSNRKSFDGKPVPAGKVLVPFVKDLYSLQEGDYILEYFTTMQLGEFRFEVGFMPIIESKYASYMEEFGSEISRYMEICRERRCIIGQNPDGTNKICPSTRRCTGCPEKGLHERKNIHSVKILSLDYLFTRDNFDIPDESQTPVESQALDNLYPEPTYDEVKVKMLSYFNEKDPQQAQIIKLELEGKSIDEICVSIKLKPRRGREVINKANNDLCDYLKLRHMKKKPK